MRKRCLMMLSLLAALLAVSSAHAAEKVRTGEVKYLPPADETGIPDEFRLKEHTFKFEETVVSEDEKVVISTIAFPSPVKTPHENNNTVHCEYYRPAGNGKKYPAVVVLHILGGDFPLSRLFCAALANGEVAALFVKMPYYGPRRQPGVSTRMISIDPEESVKNMRQAILDIRRGAAFLAARDEIDAKQLGIFGISLGGITAALAGGLEPRFAKICPMLAGGDIAKVALDSPELARVREQWKKKNGDKIDVESMGKLLKKIDPVTYAANVKGRKVLMFNAVRDEVIPRRCTDALWESFGRPKVIWYDAGHYSAILHVLDAATKTTQFFQPEK